MDLNRLNDTVKGIMIINYIEIRLASLLQTIKTNRYLTNKRK